MFLVRSPEVNAELSHFPLGARRIVGQNPDAKAFRFLLLSVSYGKNATLKNFFSELKRRNVYKVAVAYAVIGWLLVQVATQVFPFFDIPNWAVRLVVLAIVIGFPIALVIAWAFELTPQGLKRTEDVDLAAQSRRKSYAWIYVVVVGVVFSIGLVFIGRYTARTTVTTPRTETATGSSIPQKSIAVLPFENLSDDKGAAYFADGIQDEILTKLASIADLKVISRTSTAKYKSKPEDLRTVSQQLGVATVLEGSVQKAADKVRVNVQLIDARADSHLWAKTYDRDIKDVFAVESEVAQEIADSLQAKLSPAEASTLATAPTKDTAAYDLFLKGEFQLRAATTSLRPESFDEAIAWYQQAIARDPNFALAMARLAECRLSQHWFVETFTESELAEVKRTAEHALALAPDLAQAHIALGLFYYYGYRQYEQALAEFGRALQLQPNNAQALEYSGYVYRRQGQWQRCLDTLKKSLEQDPRNADVAGNLSQTYCILRMWQDAERVGKYALGIDPSDVIGMRALLLAILNGSGDIKRAQGVLATFPSTNDLISSSASGIVASVTGDRAYTFVFARDFGAALKVWETSADTAADQRRRLSAKAAIRALAGDFTGAQADAENARQLLEERLRERPNERVSMRELIWVYLALKRDADALKLARQAVDLLPPEKDALLGNSNLAGLAEVEARTGAASDAIAILRRLLTIPAGETVSIARLKIDPVWDRIRNDPGFQQLLSGTEHIGP